MHTNIRFRSPLLGGLTLVLSLPSPLLALPEGAQVRQGQAAITQSANQLRVDQQSQAITVDWRSFDVAQDERVQFVQPGRNAVAVNRIFDIKASDIRGRIDANGRVVLANPHGIVFGESATVNVDALVAAAAELPLSSVIDGQHLLDFVAADGGAIIQRGVIEAATAAHLFAHHVDNAGTVLVEGGLVHLSSADQAVLTFDAAGYLGLAIDGAVLSNELGVDAAVVNSGDIQAGRIVMSAETVDGVFRSAVRQSGKLEATGVSIENGSIRLSASGAALEQDGELRAVRGDRGGDIKLLGDGPIRLTSNSSIQANGVTEGGNVQIGAPRLSAAETQAASITMSSAAHIRANGHDGAGGRVTLIADESVALAGNIEATGTEGGFVELSAYDRVSAEGADISTAAADGSAGTLLIDPGNITIGDGGDFSFALLNGFLQDNNLVITTADSDAANPGNDIGDISFVSAGDIELLAPRSLDLQAHNNVSMPFRLGVNGASLNVNVQADLDGDGVGSFLMPGILSTRGGDLSVTAARIDIGGQVDLGDGRGEMSSRNAQELRAGSRLSADSWVLTSQLGAFIQDSGSELQAANNVTIDARGILASDIQSATADLKAGSQGLFVGLFDAADPGLTASSVTAESDGSAWLNLKNSASLTLESNGWVNVQAKNDLTLVGGPAGAPALSNRSTAVDAETTIVSGGRLIIEGDVNHQSDARFLLGSASVAGDALSINGNLSALNAGIELQSNGGANVAAGRLLQSGLGGISLTLADDALFNGNVIQAAPVSHTAPLSLLLAAGSGLRSAGRIELRADQVNIDGEINGLTDREIGILATNIELGANAFISNAVGDIAFGGLLDTAVGNPVPHSAERFIMAAGSRIQTPASVLIAADLMQLADIQAGFTGLYSAGNIGAVNSVNGTRLSSGALLLHALGDVNLDWGGGTVAAVVNNGSLALRSDGDIRVGDIDTELPTQGITLTGGLASQGLTIESRNLQFSSDVSVSGDSALNALVSQAVTVDSGVSVSTQHGAHQYQGQGADGARAARFEMASPSALNSETGDILIYASDVVVDDIVTQGQTNISSNELEVLRSIQRSGAAGISIVGTIIRQPGDVILSTEQGDILISANNGAPAQSFEMDPGARIQSLSGNVTVLSDSMVLALISTGGDVTLNGSSGFGAISMADGGLISANGLSVNNLGDVSLRTGVNRFSAQVGQGGLSLFNQGDLRIVDSGVQADNGVAITAASPLTVDAAVSSAGDIELHAGESADADDDLNLQASVTSTGGNVILRAGDAVSIEALVSARQGDISVNAGFADSDGLSSAITANANAVLTAQSIELAAPGNIGSLAQAINTNSAALSAAGGGVLNIDNRFNGTTTIQELVSNGELRFNQSGATATGLRFNGQVASQGGAMALNTKGDIDLRGSLVSSGGDVQLSSDQLLNSARIDAGAGLLSILLGNSGVGGDSVLGTVSSTQTVQVSGGAGDDGLTLDPQSTLSLGAANTALSNNELQISGVERLQLQGDSRGLIGSDNSTVYTLLSGTDKLQVQGMQLQNVADLIAGSGSDSLLFEGNAVLTASVDLGAGADAVTMNSGSRIEGNLNLGAGADALNLQAGGSVLGGVDGGADADSLNGYNQASDWTLSGDGAGSLSTNGLAALNFNGFETLRGGADIDRIQIGDGARLSGVFDSGGGNDIWTLLSDNIDLVGGLSGGAGDDVLNGPDLALSYHFTGADTLTVAGVSVSEMETVNAGSAADRFSWNDAVRFNGSIDAGAGNDLFTLPVDSGANAVSGGSGVDQFVGLTAQQYVVSGDQLVLFDDQQWSNIENWQASDVADVLLWRATGRIAGEFKLAGGDDVIEFDQGLGANIASLLDMGTGADRVTVSGDARLILQPAAGELTLNDSLLLGAERFSFSGSDGVVEADQSLVWQLTGTSGELDVNALSFEGVGSVLSRGESDRLRASDNNTLIQVELGPDIAVAGGIRFIGMENIEGGAGADTINFDDNAVLSGGVSGGGGNDIFNNVGDTSVAGNIAGNDGNDTFNISGTLISGILQGGAGDDTFNFNQTTVAAVDGGAGGLDQINFISPDAGGQWDIGDQQSQLTNESGAMLLFGVELLVDASAFAPQVAVNGGNVEINDGSRIDFENRDATSLRFNRDANGELVLSAGDITVNDLSLEQGNVSLDAGEDGEISGSGLTTNRLTVVNADTVDLEADVSRVDGNANTLFQLANDGDLNIGRVVSAGVIDISSLNGSLLVGVPGVNLQGQQISLKAAGDVGTRAQPFTLNAESIVVTADGLIVAPLTIGSPSIDLFGQVAQSFTSLIAVSGISGAVQTLLKELATVNAAIFTALLPFTADEESVRFALNWLQEAGYLRDEDLEQWVPMILEELRAQSVPLLHEHQLSEHRFGFDGRS